MIERRKLMCGLLFAAFTIATYSTFAQQSAFPFPESMQAPPSPFPTQRNVDTEVSRMTQRYGLSNDQAAQLRTILTDEQQKAATILKDPSLTPPDLFSKMKSLKEDETTLISAILTPEQRTKYQNDMKQGQGSPSQAPTGFLPPPPSPGAAPTNSN